jgi:cysteine desulfurase
MKKIYLDYAATTPTHPDVLKVMMPYFNEAFGNPSSIYSYGQEAREAIEIARSLVAGLINARSEEIVFTGGGTESDNFALNGVAFANESKGNHIITNAIEHHAVLETCGFLEKRGISVTHLSVDGNGLVDPDDVKKAITSKTILVSVMHANNEVGTIQPLEAIGKITREAGVLFHTDAVQTAGHIPVDVYKLGVDLLSISAHKLYGPKGIGALYIRKGTKILPFIHGGGQEKGRRSGTENVTGIVGFGKATEIAQLEMDGEALRIMQLRDKLIRGLFEHIPDIRLNGHPSQRLPNNVNISVAFVEGESMCLNLDMEGICVSTGSACSSSNLGSSHVLVSMGIDHVQAHGSLRFTMGKWTTDEDIDKVLETLPRVITKLREMSPLYKK